MVTRRKILLVDDDVRLLAELESFLAREGYQVLCAVDGEDALRKAASFQPHLLILDILMPQPDGREVLRRLRQRGDRVPVIMLTQVKGVDSRIRTLNAGADDYINKPFSPGELLARSEAVLRRAYPEQPDAKAGRWCCCEKLRVDCQAHRAYLGRRELPLSPKEVGILEYLMHHAGEPVEYESLVAAVWGREAVVGYGSLYVCVNRIRRALGDDAARSRYIETLAGLGYRFIGKVEVLP